MKLHINTDPIFWRYPYGTILQITLEHYFYTKNKLHSMKENKILPQTYLFFSKSFPKFSLIQLNEVVNLATICLAKRNSQRERQCLKVPSFFFSKRSRSSCHDKVLQSYGTKCEAGSRMNSVLLLKA